MRILLADDHELVRDGLKPILARLADCVTVLEAASYPEALEKAGAEPSLELAILDLKMPGMNGFSGLQGMRLRFPDLPLVVLSGSVVRSDVLAAMKAGAAAYIPKTTGGPAILSALRLVLCGEKYFPPELINPGFGGQPTPCSSEPAGPFANFADRERDVVRLLLEGKANKEIARELGVEEITVKKRLSRVYKQLGVENKVQLLLLLGVDRDVE